MINYIGLTIGILTCTLNVYADKGIVTANTLNVRSAPGIEYQIISKLNNGESVNIVEKVNDWYGIELENNNGKIEERCK